MKWTRVGDMGMQAGEYRVAKCVVDDGTVTTVYVLHHKHDRLGYFNNFDECQQKAEEHADNVEFSGTPAASSPEAPPERRVGPLGETP